MKKTNLILVALVAMLTVVFTSCSKEESVTPQEQETGYQVSDLQGDWYFQSLVFNGVTYTDCDVEMNREYDWLTINLSFAGNTMNLTSNCVDNGIPVNKNYEFTLENNVIIFPYRKFEILSLTTTTLKLKLIEVGSTDELINGVYTLTKS